MNIRLAFSLFWIVLASHVSVGTAQRFRIDTDVFQEGVNPPISQNITLFLEGMVYDFMMTGPNKEIAIFDIKEGLFVLLDPVQKVRATLKKQDIRDINLSIRLQGSKRDRAFFTPQFEQHYDQQTGWLTLKNRRITYRVRGEMPTTAGPIAQYRLFADWYAKLNATKLGTMPPFPRLALNQAIEAYRIIPEEVQLTIEPGSRKERKLQVRSKHLVTWELSNKDFENIQRAHKFWKDFKSVQLKEYRRHTKVASRDD